MCDIDCYDVFLSVLGGEMNFNGDCVMPCVGDNMSWMPQCGGKSINSNVTSIVGYKGCDEQVCGAGDAVATGWGEQRQCCAYSMSSCVSCCGFVQFLGFTVTQHCRDHTLHQPSAEGAFNRHGSEGPEGENHSRRNANQRSKDSSSLITDMIALLKMCVPSNASDKIEALEKRAATYVKNDGVALAPPAASDKAAPQPTGPWWTETKDPWETRCCKRFDAVEK